MRGRRSTARRYATALLEASLGRGSEEEFIGLMRGTMAKLEEPDLKAFLAHPSIPLEEKDGIINEISEGNKLLSNFICLLIRRNRLEMFPEIVEEYEEMLMRYKGIEKAEVITPKPLSDEDLEMIRDRLGRKFGKRFSIKIHIDPSLIGGIVIRIRDLLIDGSLRSRLESLRALISGEEV